MIVPFAMAAFGMSLVGCAPRTILVQPERSHTIVVSGQGQVFSAPDMGRVRLGVEQRAVSADAAMKSANEQMAAILKALKEKGVAEQDVQTTDLSMYFEQSHEPPAPVPVAVPARDKMGAPNEAASPEQTPKGFYVVRNTVVVSVRKLDQIGALIGAAMSAGANQLHGFELTLEDPTRARDQARAKAVENAIKKAKQLAQEAHLELGPVIEVSETGGGEAAPMMAEYSFKRTSMVPVEQGELSLTQSVQVVFEIKN